MKFNLRRRAQNRTFNHEGELAWGLDQMEELYTAVVASSLNETHYEFANKRLRRICSLIGKVGAQDPEFVAKLAVYTREEMHLRLIPLVVLVELARIHRGDNLIRRALGRVIKRADEITELLAYYQWANKREGSKKLNKLSKQIQKGLADAFNRFDAYQFAKYNRAKEIKLRDALFLVHPKAKNHAQQEIFDNIANERLKPAETWEKRLSGVGQKQFESQVERKEAVRESWTELVMSGKLGYMAMLRNLRNILESGVSYEVIQSLISRLTNRQAVLKSRQLPFRFLSAHEELKAVKSGYTGKILDALERAMEVAVENIPGFDWDSHVLIATDLSGSMESKLSPRSKMDYKGLGTTLAAMIKAKCPNVITGGFGDKYKIIQMGTGRILSNAQTLRSLKVGYSTNGYLVIQDLVQRKLILDKILIFTDCQLWNSKLWTQGSISKEWARYQKIAPNAQLYLFDLTGYGNTPVDTSHKNVFLISGWSEKVFKMMEALDSGDKAIEKIKSIEL